MFPYVRRPTQHYVSPTTTHEGPLGGVRKLTQLFIPMTFWTYKREGTRKKKKKNYSLWETKQEIDPKYLVKVPTNKLPFVVLRILELKFFKFLVSYVKQETQRIWI